MAIKYKVGDYIGNNFLLTKRIKPIKNGRGFLCEFKCPKCGKLFEADLYNLTYKKSKYVSCGCYRQEKIFFQKQDLTGQKFGLLTVIKQSQRKDPHPNGGYTYFWDCLCECGEKTIVSTSHLTSGHTSSCGKCCISKGELRIKTILQNLHIEFEQQKRFKDCRDKNPLPFDFYLPDYNCCIEYDGEQHFNIPKNRTSTFFTTDRIQDTKKKDNIKTQYCKNNNIKLIRIPYYDYDKISSEYLINKIKEGV